MPKILIAGGGSGGHVAPAIAVAEVLQEQNYEIIIGHSGRQIDLKMIEGTGFQETALNASPLQFSPKGLLQFCKNFKLAVQRTRNCIQQENIQCLLSTGGFVAAPALYAAKNTKTPSILLNLDCPPGKANQLAKRWANHLATTVECGWKNAQIIDPPLRKASTNCPKNHICKSSLGLNPKLKTLLVTGASQGAKTINELIPMVAQKMPEVFNGWQILHLSGMQHKDVVQDLWNRTSVPAIVIDFLENIAFAWNAADLAISRGGANTIAEIAFHSVPTIILPYPFHKDNHQKKNALPLQICGGAEIVADHKTVIKNIQDAGMKLCKLLQSDTQRTNMRESLRALNTKNGAETLANLCVLNIP